MAGWVRALNQCANVETETPAPSLNRTSPHPVELQESSQWDMGSSLEPKWFLFPNQSVNAAAVSQEQTEAHRELWMMDDILSGLRVNKNNFRVAMESPRHSEF
ncbi:UNVERIFIED_CONTAM: hypothetical protein FKN15_005662 [Acipenser sinensis]